MKTPLRFSRFVLLISILGLLIGCGKDDTATEGDPPTLTVTAVVVNGPSLTNNGEVVATDTIDFLIDVDAPAGFNSILIGGSGHSVITTSDAGVADGATLVEDATYRVLTSADDGEANASYVFVAIDELGQQSDSVRFSFEIGSIVNSYTNIMLGGFENTTTNGFLNTIENEVYALTSAILNSNNVDLLFYHQTTPGYTIAALDDSDADAAIQAQTINGDLDDFPIRNQTRFKTFSSNPDFNEVRSVTDLENAHSGNTSSSGLSSVSGLSAGNVFGFQLTTSRGEKIGLIRVNQTAGTIGSNRAIQLDIKIQP